MIYDVIFAIGYNDSIKGLPQIPISNPDILRVLDGDDPVGTLEAYFDGWKKGNDKKRHMSSMWPRKNEITTAHKCFKSCM